MNRRYVVAATFLGIAACATSGPDSPVPSAKVETSVTTSNPTATEGEFEDVDVPEVPKVANIWGQANIPGQSEVVCRNEIPTGSHMVTRVCRTLSEIEKKRTESKIIERH